MIAGIYRISGLEVFAYENACRLDADLLGDLPLEHLPTQSLRANVVLSEISISLNGKENEGREVWRQR
jgi:hypothetical protein